MCLHARALVSDSGPLQYDEPGPSLNVLSGSRFLGLVDSNTDSHQCCRERESERERLRD